MRRFIPRVALALALGTTLISCRSTTQPDGVFSASTSGMDIRLSNRANATVFYFMVDPGMLALINYAPCTSRASGCKVVEPHSTVNVPRSAIMGYRANLEEAVVVYWMVREGIMADKAVTEGWVRVRLN